MLNPFTRISMLLVLVGLGFALGGCQEEEIGRPLFYDKGAYIGQADEPLSPEVVEQLRQRVSGQGAGGL